MNKSDSERIATVLEKKGFQPASKENEANLIVVNMCSVRQSAVDRVYGKIRDFANLKSQNSKLKTILTGCILKKDKKNFSKSFDYIFNIKDLVKWLNILKPYKNYLEIQSKYSNNFSAFVPISNGCNNFCSYCVVPYVRGPLVCRDHKGVLEEVKNVIKKGFKEVWLLGQNVNDYKSPINHESNSRIFANKLEIDSRVINFAKLLKMVNSIPSDFKFFFVSPHPKNFSDELIDTLAQCKKFGKYLNLPVQSGDNGILKKMNRNYTVKEYQRLVKKIRKKIPGIKLSTDIIVGFPGETKKQFENTVKLFKEIKFNMAYIAKYSPRPETAAFKLRDDVPLSEKKRREKILRELIHPVK